MNKVGLIIYNKAYYEELARLQARKDWKNSERLAQEEIQYRMGQREILNKLELGDLHQNKNPYT